MANQRGGFLKFPSSVFFNLFALAIFLVVVIVLHQVLKNPQLADSKKQVTQRTTQKAIQETAQTQSKTKNQNQAVVDLPEPEVVKTKPVAKKEKPKQQTVKKKTKTKEVTKRYRPRKRYVHKKIEKEPSIAELDSEQARQKYLRLNKQKSSGIKIKQPATNEVPIEHLDNEAARAYYQEQNRRLSRELVYSDQ